jgi:predicted DNA-binding transcriptional regulator YafY
MDTIICEAIKNKQIITFEYELQLRTVEPYRLGISTKHNKVLRCFQLKNSSKLYEKPDWRLFDLSNIKRIQLTSDSFRSIRSDYGSSDKSMIRPYICEVSRY